MTSNGAHGLTSDQRSAFRTLAEFIVPGDPWAPSASEVDISGRRLDRALRARPDLLAILSRALGQVDTRDPAAQLEELDDRDPLAFRALVSVIIAAYYYHPRARKCIGYPGQRARPIAEDESEYFLRDELLGPVLYREPIHWRG